MVDRQSRPAASNRVHRDVCEWLVVDALDASRAADLGGYRLYRGTTPGFVPGPGFSGRDLEHELGGSAGEASITG